MRMQLRIGHVQRRIGRKKQHSPHLALGPRAGGAAEDICRRQGLPPLYVAELARGQLKVLWHAHDALVLLLLAARVGGAGAAVAAHLLLLSLLLRRCQALPHHRGLQPEGVQPLPPSRCRHRGCSGLLPAPCRCSLHAAQAATVHATAV